MSAQKILMRIVFPAALVAAVFFPFFLLPLLLSIVLEVTFLPLNSFAETAKARAAMTSMSRMQLRAPPSF
jgi:hypothetical protein